jgi:PhnB protein
MTRISAYLRFNGKCREAMTFYKECLGAELILQTVGESAMAGQMPSEAQNHVMHSTLTKGDLVLLGSDMLGPEGLVNGNSMSLLLDCSSEEEIRSFYSALSAGGQATAPLKVEFWGSIFGILVDKFGKEWMLNYEKKPA